MPPHNHILNVWREPLFQALLPGALYWFGKWNFRGGQTFPKEDMSVAEYITQASRSPALADVMSAGIHGVWGGDINKLSAMSVFSWFFHVSSMTRAESDIVRRRFTEEKFKRSFLAENPDLNRMYHAKPTLLTCGEYGLESLPTAIHDMLKSPGSGVDIKLGTAVSKVAKGNDGEKIAVCQAIILPRPKFMDTR
jgi:protoporphyrinogen/coproporphyrinogen III oxidase